jgi:hypothetical protein
MRHNGSPFYQKYEKILLSEIDGLDKQFPRCSGAAGGPFKLSGQEKTLPKSALRVIEVTGDRNKKGPGSGRA